MPFNRPPTEEEKELLKNLFWTEGEAADAYLNYWERMRRGEGLTWGLPAMDAKYTGILPLQPGDVAAIMARPGHGKSTLAAYFARYNAIRLLAQDKKDERIIYGSWEQSIEELEALMEANEEINVNQLAWGDADIERVRYFAAQREKLPVWYLGRSISKRRKQPRMTASNVFNAIRLMEEQHGIKPALLIIDYIQLLEPEQWKQDKVLQVGEAMANAKNLALEIPLPVLVLVQASREADKTPDRIPQADMGQWSSAIEQNVDKLFAIMRPVLYAPLLPTKVFADKTLPVITLDGQELKVTQRLFVIRCWKQRFSLAGQTFLAEFAPELVRLSELEMDRYLANGGF